MVDAFAVGGGEGVAEAEEGEELVAHAGEHVFGLPGFVAGDGGADVEGVEPGHAGELFGLGLGLCGGFVGVAVEELESWGEGAEFLGRDEGEIDLEGVFEEEDAVEPGAELEVEVAEGGVVCVHGFGPVVEDGIEGGGVGEGEVDVGPLVFGVGGGGAGDGGGGDAGIGFGLLDEAGAEGGAVGGSEHGYDYCCLCWGDADFDGACFGIGRVWPGVDGFGERGFGAAARGERGE